MSATFFSDQKDWFFSATVRLPAYIQSNSIVGAQTEQRVGSLPPRNLSSLYGRGLEKTDGVKMCRCSFFDSFRVLLHSKPFILNNELSNVRVMYFWGQKFPQIFPDVN